MNKAFWEKFSHRKIIVVAHESSEGPPQELREFFLQKKVKKILYIAHPLIFLKEFYQDSSRGTWYKNGKVSKSQTAFHWRLPEPFLYAKDILYTITWVLQSKDQFDLFFGADPLNAFSGILLRKLNRVKKVVYYSIDYTPKRFENSFFNYAYHLIDRFCCSSVDVNWVGTCRTTEARIANGVSREKMAKVIVVPDGSHSLAIKDKDITKVRMNLIVYVGFIMKKQGLDLIIDSLSEIKKDIHGIKLVVIGKGPYLPQIKKKITRLGLDGIVEFKGFIKNNNELQDVLKSCAIGLAPYVEDKDSYTYYSPAGKPVLYLACGLPVIITDVPPIAREISEKKAGIMIHYKKDQFINAVLTLLKNKRKYSIYKKNAISFGEKLDWSDIFEEGIYETQKELFG